MSFCHEIASKLKYENILIFVGVIAQGSKEMLLFDHHYRFLIADRLQLLLMVFGESWTLTLEKIFKLIVVKWEIDDKRLHRLCSKHLCAGFNSTENFETDLTLNEVISSCTQDLKYLHASQSSIIMHSRRINYKNKLTDLVERIETEQIRLTIN